MNVALREFGDPISEIVHIGLAAIQQIEANSSKNFNTTIFNYPTMAEGDRGDAHNGVDPDSNCSGHLS
ncbi:hypothetical protein [Halomonas saccharevitans]|uniref:NAD(P) transhydrogenase n=1 Tax=Halomonas saccharevitans TaxID=416872 RepID=A0A1I7ARI4_9GAMM|nr:hypothetical protein [Halomonas saccharevitans]SFT77505.1 NAD(P) transhydrogenase [Halomonas saccharevitans]